jgi:signal transduction histidine kinase/CheY-like chemotaxis protein
LAGYTREELLGMIVSDLFPPEEMARNPISVAELRQGKTVVKERRLLRKDGGLLPVEISARMLPAGNLLGIVRDATDRKRAEEELVVSRNRLSRAEIISRCGNWEFDLGRQKVFASEGARRIYGLLDGEWTIAEAQTIPLPEYRDILNSALRGLVDENLPYDVEFKIRRPDTGEIADIHSVAEYDPRRHVVFGIIQDITDRKRAEEEGRRLQEQLDQARKMESVGRLAGGVAHDFNNMLGVILGYTELSLVQVDPAGSLHFNLKEIQAATRRSADLTRQLLAFARKQTIAPRALDLNATLEAMLKMLRRLIGEDIALAWLPESGVWPIMMDPSQVDQILANLCVNARDAIAGVGTVTIETKNATFDEAYCAAHAGFSPGEYVMLAVSDNGCGMDKTTLGILFEPFFTTKETGKGTGLGLATVYGIVSQNHGFINVYSEPGEGTTFRIYLPRYREAAVARAAEEAPASVAHGHGTILLVEDESMILDIGRAMLEALGYRVLTAATPGEALRLAREHAGEIRLLMTDVIMPEMNGRELAQDLRSLCPQLKCLFTSGYTANVIAHHGVLEKGINFIPKPFSIQELAVHVRKALESE